MVDKLRPDLMNYIFNYAIFKTFKGPCIYVQHALEIHRRHVGEKR